MKILEGVKYKLTSLFFKKEKDFLIKKYKRKRFFDLILGSIINFLVGVIAGLTAPLISLLFVLVCLVFNYDVRWLLDIFVNVFFVFGIVGFGTLFSHFVLNKGLIKGFINEFEMIKNNDVNGFNKQVFDLEDDYFIEEMKDCIVDNETLSIMKKEILNHITKEELNSLFKKDKFINLSEKGSITYKYFYHIIREVEKKRRNKGLEKETETERIIKFQENVFLKKENVNQEIKDNIANRVEV